MPNQPSISQWLQGLQAGDAAVMQQLWDAFYTRLIAAANLQIRSAATHLVEGEDVVASVFESVWKGGQAGRFHSVASVDQMFWLLLAMTRRKCIDHLRRTTAARRGGELHHVSLDSPPADQFRAIVSTEPDPRYVSELNDQLQCFFQKFPDPILQQITVLRIEGHDIAAIAAQLQLAESTIRRKLKLIQQIFEDELRDER